MTVDELRIDAVIVTCAVSAGIHGALVPEHFAEGAGAGVGFAVATVLLGALAVLLTRGATPVALAAAAVVLAGLLASYALAVTTGLPVVHPHVESVDGLALFTKAVEGVGLVSAAGLLSRHSFAAVSHLKGTLT